MTVGASTRLLGRLGLLAIAALGASTFPRPGRSMAQQGGVSVTATTPSAVVGGNTQFALDLYARLRSGTGNRFFSPYSVSTALAMTYAGARGETARQMAATLHFGKGGEAFHAGFRDLIATINGRPPGETGNEAKGARPYILATANALWGQRDEGFLPEFIETTSRYHGAAPREVDFRGQAALVRVAINEWVEEHTARKIKDLIGPSDLTAQTKLVLVNAIYFKGDWTHPFAEAATNTDGVFHAMGGRVVKAPMMAQLREFAYHDGGTFHLVELPYGKGELSMVVLLPKEREGFPALESSLSAPSLERWLAATTRRRVDLWLPRFTLTESLQLADVLAAMGMPDAFDGGKADFSGMNGRRDLAISRVIHKAFVDVNEKGTEAAAATAVAMVRAMAIAPTPPVVFHADHPFVFLIHDKATGSLLFLGRLVEPG